MLPTFHPMRVALLGLVLLLARAAAGQTSTGTPFHVGYVDTLLFNERLHYLSLIHI